MPLIDPGRCGLAAGSWRQGKLAPDNLSAPGAPGSPALRHLADYLKPAAALIIVCGLPEPRQRGRVVEHFAEEPAFQDQTQADLALGIPNGVSDQLGNDKFGRRNQLGKVPLAHRPLDQGSRSARGGQFRRQIPRHMTVSTNPSQPGHEYRDVIALMVVVDPGKSEPAQVL